MEWLLFLGVVSPILFITGLIVCVKWLMRGGSTERETIAKSLRELANRQTNPHAANIVKAIAEAVSANRLETIGPFEIRSAHHSETLSAGVEAHPGVSAAAAMSAPPAYNQQEVSPAHAVTSNAPAPILNQSAGDAFKQLNNINVLLYLGAFMVVVSVGIFVGYNFSTLSGGAKTALVGLFAALFYVSGLILYRFSTALKPAGITFNAIGLILLPLVGTAYYNFVSGAHSIGPAIWIFVSVISILAGLLTFLIIRQQFAVYFTTLSLLSLTESIIHASNLPVYYMAWGFLLTAALLTLLSRRGQQGQAVTDPMANSAMAMAPAAAVVSLFYALEQGIGQLGVTALLSAAYYEIVSRITPEERIKYGYYALSRTLVAVGVVLLVADAELSSLTSGLIVAATGTTLIALSAIEVAKAKLKWAEVTAVIGGLTTAAAAGFVFDHPGQLTLILMLGVLANLTAALLWRFASNLLLGVVLCLLLPAVAIMTWLEPKSQDVWTSVAYIVLATLLLWLRKHVAGWQTDHIKISQFGYIAALVGAFFTAAIAGQLPFILLGTVIAALAYGISFAERRPEIAFAAAAIFFAAVSQIVPWADAENSLYVVTLGLAGLVVYGLGVVDRRSNYLRLSGAAGVGLGVIAGGLADQKSLAPAGGLVVIAVLAWAEWTRAKQAWLLEAAAGILIVALAKFLWFNGITMTAVYANLIGAYLAWLAYRRHKANNINDRDLFTMAALGAVTIPIGMESLESDGQFHGLILTLESVTLVLIGIALQYRLVWMWAAITLVIEVLYQTRDILYALPKYVITAILGLALLGGAIWMLVRRSKSDPHD